MRTPGRTRRSLCRSSPGSPCRAIFLRSHAHRGGPACSSTPYRDALDADREGTLRAVAEIGYREVELAGLAGATAHAMQASLKRHGLEAPSMHASYDRLQGDLDAVLEEARILGANYLVCPSVDAEERKTAERLEKGLPDAEQDRAVGGLATVIASAVFVGDLRLTAHARRAAREAWETPQVSRVVGNWSTAPAVSSATAGTGSGSENRNESVVSAGRPVASTTHHDASSAMPFGSVK